MCKIGLIGYSSHQEPYESSFEKSQPESEINNKESTEIRVSKSNKEVFRKYSITNRTKLLN